MCAVNFSTSDVRIFAAATGLAQYGYIPAIVLAVWFNSWALVVIGKTKELHKIASLFVIGSKIGLDIFQMLCHPIYWMLEASDPLFADRTPEWLCQLRYAWGTYLNIGEPYCIVFTSLDRFVATLFPFRYRVWITARRLNVGFVIVQALAFIYSAATFPTIGIHDHQCWYAIGYEQFYATIRSNVLLIMANIVPLALICALNVGIVLGMRRSAARVGHQVAPKERDHAKEALHRSITVTLIVEAFFLVVLTVPALVANIFYRAAQLAASQFPTAYATWYLAFNAGLVLSMGSRSVNFFVFYACMKAFRKQCNELCRRWCVCCGQRHRHNLTSVKTTNNTLSTK